jgi:ABC-type multidrug transport system fused ATPase/permease subunit
MKCGVSRMLEEWIVVMIGVAVVAIAIAVAAVYLKNREVGVIVNRQRLKVYEDLFHAITALNVAGNDPDRLNRAKMQLAFTLNRLNLVASPDVLTQVNQLLDFLNECKDNEFDVLKQLNILNSIVIAVRNDLDPATARFFEKEKFRFKFYSPKRQ